MTKWEYATIYFWRGIGGATLLHLPGDGEQKFAGTFIELTRVLNLLGRDGWELVAVSQENSVWTLKRAL